MERNLDTPGFHGLALSRAYFGTLNLGYVGFYAATANDLLNEANSSGERGLRGELCYGSPFLQGIYQTSFHRKLGNLLVDSIEII